MVYSVLTVPKEVKRHNFIECFPRRPLLLMVHPIYEQLGILNSKLYTQIHGEIKMVK